MAIIINKFKIMLIVISLIFLTFGFQPTIKADPIIHEVNPGESIQAAINAANPGDTIFVYNGIYYENLFIDKRINLEGENKNTTFIDGGVNGNGVTIYDANNVKISGFTIQNSNGIIMSGVVIWDASNNEIYDNIIKNNYFGINIKDYSSGNIIYHNLFIDNTINAIDYTSCENQWDDSYPSGGNFWGDYTGDDNYNGPGQNITGSDGIFDEPYIIKGPDNCQDRYPLVELSFIPNNPPNTPSNPNPANHATNIPIDTILSWSCTDPDEDLLTYDIYFGTTINPPKVSDKQSDTTFNPGPLNYNTPYYWKIVAWDNHYASKSSPIWDFITISGAANNPPNTPSNPNPANHAVDISINAELSWTCTDPDGDPLTYDVYFGTSTNPPKKISNQTTTNYDPVTMNYNTKYYWKIVAWDDNYQYTTSPIWDFTTGTEANNPPNTPSNPSPANSATSIDLNTDLSWTCSDPDEDPLTYDIYFGTNNNPPQVSFNQTSTTYNPGTMSFSTTYYWKIVAWDDKNLDTVGPVWIFNTIVNNPPDPPRNPNPSNHNTLVDINADLSWIGSDPDNGDTLTYDIYFGTNTNPPKIISNQTTTNYDLVTMNYNTKYYWKIIAWDNKNTKNVGPIWDFTTSNEPNEPPNTPSTPNPTNNAIGIDINTVLSWTGGDPDTGDTVTYDIYFGTNSNPPLIKTNHDSTSYNPNEINPNTKYYWKIVAKDNHGAATTGPIWYFTTIYVNYPPDTPNNPTPQNGKTSININQDLYWDGGDPNTNDTVTYDIYFGTSPSPGKIKSNQTGTSYNPDKMDYNTKYYWKIIAWDNHGKSSMSPTWSYTTGPKSSEPGGEDGGTILQPNKKPIANASASDHSGYINIALTFDASFSIDEDGEIIEYTWDFGDNNNGKGIITTHIYKKNGTYTVKLTVTDDNDVIDTDSFKVTITQLNNLPTTPQIDGPKTGKQNIEYTFTVTSTDPDNDNIYYVFNWDDDQTNETNFIPSGTTYTEKHKWTKPGVYKIQIYAIDNNYAVSPSAETTILIDTFYCKHLGYLIDKDSDKTYDLFYSNQTGIKTTTKKQADGSYLINNDMDSQWDYIYNLQDDILNIYSSETNTEEQETDNIIYYVVILGIIIIVILLVAVLKSKKQTKKQVKKADEKKSKKKE